MAIRVTTVGGAVVAVDGTRPVALARVTTVGGAVLAVDSSVGLTLARVTTIGGAVIAVDLARPSATTASYARAYLVGL